MVPLITPRTREKYLFDMEQLFHDKVDLAPLSQRAWAFQERLLLRRVLHFCDSVVLFECNTMRASELYCRGQPYQRKVYIRHDGKLHESKYLELLRRPPLKEDEEVIVVGRRLMTRKVPRTNHSFAIREDISDKLIALSGLVKLIQKSTKMKYVAGLWEETLEMDLLWTPSETPSSRPHQYIAPSWSWAALDGKLEPVLTKHCRAVRAGLETPLAIHIYLVFRDFYHDIRESNIRSRQLDRRRVPQSYRSNEETISLE